MKNQTKKIFDLLTLKLAYMIESENLVDALLRFNQEIANSVYPELDEEEHKILNEKLKEDVESLLSGKKNPYGIRIAKNIQYKLRVIADRSSLSQTEVIEKLIDATEKISITIEVER